MTTARMPLILLLVAAACGGANLNRRGAGNRDGGIWMQEDEIAVDARGEVILVRAGAELKVGDLATQKLTRIEGIADARLLAFWAGSAGSGFHVLRRAAGDGAAEELVSYDLRERRVLWRRPLPASERERVHLDVTPDGRRVVVTGAEVVLVDAASGAIAGTFRPPGVIEDVDVTPDGGRVIVTQRETWGSGPTTPIHVVSTEGADLLCTAQVPNCADELILAPEGDRAFLAPTFCQRDPVSIVDVTASCRFEKNLPGFGPIALSPDGRTGVAFLDRNVDDPTAPPRPAEVDRSDSRFHLMFFDTRTLELRTVPVGERLPRYALTPDGTMLLLDGATLDSFREEPAPGGRAYRFRVDPLAIRIVDVAGRELRTASGPAVLLQAFVMSPDSPRAWLLHADSYEIETKSKSFRPLHARLYQLDVAAARVEPIPLAFEPLSLNITPAGRTLILRGADQIHLFDVDRREVTATFH